MKRHIRNLKRKHINAAANWSGFVISGVALGIIIGWAAVIAAGSHPAAMPTIAQNVKGLGYEIEVTSVRFDEKGSQPFVPGPDGKYVIIALNVKNTTKSKEFFAPVVQTYVRDGLGGTYDMAPAILKHPIEAKSLSPGESVSGELSYWVPREQSQIVLHFDPRWAKSAGATISLY